MAGTDSLGLSDTQRATEPSSATDAARLAPGVKAGDYVVERFLGAGAMGEVYAGKHPDIGKRVAIKVLKPSLATSAEAAERFKREARVVNQIDHPNVIDVFGFGSLDDGRLYLVMDLVDGDTLRAAVADGPMEVDRTLDVLDQIADALDAAHAKGVVHRDLKPDNVMIGGSKVFVLDFGIAKLLSSETNPATLLTGQGAWIGTPSYMAPEQWSAEGAGPASDRYALGVMAFELLSGKLPFQAPTLPQMMEQHFRAPVPALSTRGAVASRSMFDPVLARAMAKEPAKRYASAKELVAALREVAGGKPRAIASPGKLLPGLIAVTLVRGGDDKPSRAPAAGGLVELEVRSIPKRATVLRGDTMFGTTPATLAVKAGEALDLTIKKPGFAPEHKKLAASAETRAIDVVLTQINGFEGTWMLPDGQLRAFTRSGDEHVDVFKLTSLRGEKEFYRKFHLEDSPTGVRFAATDTIVDQRAPTEPSCQVPVRVEYLYDPQADALVVRPEAVETGFQDGRCVVHNRELVDAVALARAQQNVEVRTTHAPVGHPVDAPTLRPRDDQNTDKRLNDEILKKEGKSPPRKPITPNKKSKAAPPFDGGQKGAQNAPAQQNAPPPQNNQVGDIQQQVRGDSQIAPQVKK
jgi:tRNA A-37 threonylcarbamoyl transferase component Bud32